MTETPLADALSMEDIKPVNDAPPRTRTTSGKKRQKPAPTYRKGALLEPLTRMYAMMGLGLMPLAPNTAAAVVENAEACAQAWEEWAATSPTVRRLLYPLLNVSGGAKVVAVHFPIAAVAFMEMAPGSRLASQVERYLQTVAVSDDGNPAES